jgi:hypothetical protein
VLAFLPPWCLAMYCVTCSAANLMLYQIKFAPLQD